MNSVDPLLESCFVQAVEKEPRRRTLVVLRLPPGRLQRVVAWLLLPLRVFMAERRLRRSGAVIEGRFGCYPAAETPTFVYHLGSAAARYAESNLIAATAVGTVDHLLRRFLSWWTGCHCSLGAVIIVGTRGRN
jgi:hypothetical protein